MATKIENGTIFPTVEPFPGKAANYRVEAYYSDKSNRFTDMPEYSELVDTVTGLYLGVYPTRDREISIDRMRRSLSHPRTILMLARHQGNPVGFGIFPRFFIDGEPILYSTRAFMPEHEGQGLGTHVLNRAIMLHQEIVTGMHRSLRWGVLMTQNAFSIVTLKRLQESGRVGKIYPVDELYNENRDAQSILLAVHREVYMHSLGIDTFTGVSRAELKELGMNEAYRPNREHRDAWEIHQRMVSSRPDGWGMNRERGDVVYVTFELKKPNGVMVESPLAQVA